MDPYYKPFHKEAEDLRFKFHDALDDPNHPTAHVIRRELDELKADIENGKAPRAVENRARTIQRLVRQAEREQQRVISTDHTNYFHERLEDFSNNMRKHPHY